MVLLNYDLRTHIQSVALWLVNFPNGKQTVTTKCGSVKLCSNLFLENVLYIPPLFSISLNLNAFSSLYMHWVI